jgi:hypothetical protein
MTIVDDLRRRAASAADQMTQEEAAIRDLGADIARRRARIADLAMERAEAFVAANIIERVGLTVDRDEAGLVRVTIEHPEEVPQP